MAAEDIEEVMTSNAVTLKSFPSQYQSFINTFNDAKTADALYSMSSGLSLGLTSDPNKVWMRDSLMEIAKLFYLGELPMKSTASEAFVLNMMWGFMYKAFFGTGVEVLLGEKSSSSSSARRNADRKLETSSARENSIMGHKIDALFGYNGIELGCVEAGLSQSGPTTDKQLNDGMIKFPKQMKDMLCKMVERRLDLLRFLKTVGFVIMGKLFGSL